MIRIERVWTRLDAFLALVLEGSAVAGKAAENLEPVVKLIQDLSGVFAKAKLESETRSLPKPESNGVTKRISGPSTPEPIPSPPDPEG